MYSKNNQLQRNVMFLLVIIFIYPNSAHQISNRTNKTDMELKVLYLFSNIDNYELCMFYVPISIFLIAQREWNKLLLLIR